MSERVIMSETGNEERSRERNRVLLRAVIKTVTLGPDCCLISDVRWRVRLCLGPPEYKTCYIPHKNHYLVCLCQLTVYTIPSVWLTCYELWTVAPPWCRMCFFYAAAQVHMWMYNQSVILSNSSVCLVLTTCSFLSWCNSGCPLWVQLEPVVRYTTKVYSTLFWNPTSKNVMKIELSFLRSDQYLQLSIHRGVFLPKIDA